MSKLQDLIQKLCPDGVEYKKLGDVCELSRGKVYSKTYIVENAGEYPVYSSQTANNGELGRISTFDYDGEYYKEMIKSRYNVTENNKLLDRITMGRVTVN